MYYTQLQCLLGNQWNKDSETWKQVFTEINTEGHIWGVLCLQTPSVDKINEITISKGGSKKAAQAAQE